MLVYQMPPKPGAFFVVRLACRTCTHNCASVASGLQGSVFAGLVVWRQKSMGLLYYLVSSLCFENDDHKFDLCQHHYFNWPFLPFSPTFESFLKSQIVRFLSTIKECMAALVCFCILVINYFAVHLHIVIMHPVFL